MRITKPLQLVYGFRDESFQSRNRESGYQRCSDEIQDSKSHGTNRSKRAKYRSSGVTEHLWVGFADDTTLFFESVEDMQAAMNILVDIFDRYRLILNEDKTETMIFDPDIDAESNYPKTLIEINGFQIKNVQKFRFLGSHIKFNEVSTGEHEINIRLEAAKCKFAELENLLTNGILQRLRKKPHDLRLSNLESQRQAETKTRFRTPPVFTAYGM